MRVLFDNLGFDVTPQGGVSRYLAELIQNFRRLKLVTAITPFFITANRHLIDRRFWSVIPVSRKIEWRYKDYYIKRLNGVTTRAALALNTAHLFHMTYYDLSLLDAATCPTVTTVYDMIPELLPQLFPDAASIHPNKRELSQRASGVIAISHTTKSDLTRIFGIDPSKIFVTPLGIDPRWALASARRKGLPEKFVLFVGNRSPYKNFTQLLASMSRLARIYGDLFLVCVGGGSFSAEERASLTELGLADRTLQFNATDGELAYCYEKSAVFVFPSLYEGFGLPVLESFLCGCPAILSNRGSLPEVAADAALYFDPDHPQSLDDAIESVLRDSDRRAGMVRRGRLRAADYTWEKTAKQTAAAYRSVITSKS